MTEREADCLCRGSRTSTIVHGIWDDHQKQNGHALEVQVANSGGVRLFYYLRFSVMILLWIIETGIRIRHIHIEIMIQERT